MALSRIIMVWFNIDNDIPYVVNTYTFIEVHEYIVKN